MQLKIEQLPNMCLDEKLAHLLGVQGWIGAADSAPCRRYCLDKFGSIPVGIARPASTVEVTARIISPAEIFVC